MRGSGPGGRGSLLYPVLFRSYFLFLSPANPSLQVLRSLLCGFSSVTPEAPICLIPVAVYDITHGLFILSFSCNLSPTEVLPSYVSPTNITRFC